MMQKRSFDDKSAAHVAAGDTPVVFVELSPSISACQWSSNNPQSWSSSFPHPSAPRSERWKWKFDRPASRTGVALHRAENVASILADALLTQLQLGRSGCLEGTRSSNLTLLNGAS